MPVIAIALVAEDDLSMAVVKRVVLSSGGRFSVVREFVERGAGDIKRSVAKYKNSSHVFPHVVLTDLDDAACPAALRVHWDVADLPARMLFRVAVRETESWLLGDRTGFASFAGIPLNKMQLRPEILTNPKETLMALTKRGRNRRLAVELVPAAGSGARIGPLYNERLVPFVLGQWDIDTASTQCPSLQRMRDRLEGFLR